MSSPELFTDFDCRAVHTFRAWEQFEKQISGQEGAIIDVDLAPDVPGASLDFRNHLDTYRALVKLREHSGLPDQSPLVSLRLDASLMYLDVSRYGAEVDFYDYAETLLGIRPDIIDDIELETCLQSLVNFLEAHGKSFDFRDRNEFESQFGILNPEAVKNLLEEKRVRAASAVANLASAQIVDMKADVKSEDAAWIARFKFVNGRPFFWVNINPRHSHTESRLGANAIHETGHAQHFTLVKDAIAKGEMSPFLGITTEHSLECVHEEAMSQLAEQIILRQSERWQDVAEAMYKAFRTKVMHNNAHIMINNGYKEDEVVSYVKNWIPFEPENNIRKSLRARRDDPKLRAYYYCYQPALRIVEPLITMDDDRRASVLHRLYRGMLAPHQIQELVDAS